MISIVDFIKERGKKKKKRGEYNYSKDINRDNCIHKRTKIFEIKPTWEIGAASLIIECKGCTRIGVVDGSIDYDEEEVRWQT